MGATQMGGKLNDSDERTNHKNYRAYAYTNSLLKKHISFWFCTAFIMRAHRNWENVLRSALEDCDIKSSGQNQRVQRPQNKHMKAKGKDKHAKHIHICMWRQRQRQQQTKNCSYQSHHSNTSIIHTYMCVCVHVYTSFHPFLLLLLA